MLRVFVLGDDRAFVARPVAAEIEEEALGIAGGSLSHVLRNGHPCSRTMSLNEARPDDNLEVNADAQIGE